MTDQKEIWKDIEGFVGLYKISNTGKVLSLPKPHSPNYNILKYRNGGHGYFSVVLNNGFKKKNYKVHRLVAKAFIDNAGNKPCVNHLDGNKKNNNFNNLQWCTYRENCVHAIRTGLLKSNYKKGEKHRSAKLKKRSVLKIRKHFIDNNFKYGEKEEQYEKLAREHNVHIGTIKAVVRKRYWKEI